MCFVANCVYSFQHIQLSVSCGLWLTKQILRQAGLTVVLDCQFHTVSIFMSTFSPSSFCQSYDMKQHSTKVFRDIVNALGSFIQSLFIVPNAGNSAAVSAPTGQSLFLLLFPWTLQKHILILLGKLNPPTSAVLKVWPISSTVLITLWLSVQVAQVRVPRVWHKVAQVQEGSAEIFPRRPLLNSVAPGFPLWLLVSRAVLRPPSKSHVVW